jgi:hypothetical protein
MEGRKMRLVAFERGDGSAVYVNPLQIRAMLMSGDKMSAGRRRRWAG